MPPCSRGSPEANPKRQSSSKISTTLPGQTANASPHAAYYYALLFPERRLRGDVVLTGPRGAPWQELQPVGILGYDPTQDLLQNRPGSDPYRPARFVVLPVLKILDTPPGQ
ncbi:hypothetical protein H109_01809 [Trichophyton interdigitale MR816]|uniref:Uncharacterized protein n=1 Tax=Trichophyton interdigitale (strain MR816) TaxID=1215338 RepID=A0A059JEU6_TRIIM|nr:hypothetical protein H109_01809 [Trichophyton interdigitale MR816]